MPNRLTTWANLNVLTHTAQNSEFDNIYTGTIDRSAGRWGTNDDIGYTLGSSQDATLEWDTAQTQDCLMLGLSGSFIFLITDQADMATNYGLAARTDPALIIHSADATTVADYLELRHNQTDSVVNTGNGSLLLQNAATTKVTISATSVLLDDDLLFTDATYDIGASGATRPRDLYLSRDAIIGDQLAVNGVPTADQQVRIVAGAAGTTALVLQAAATPTISLLLLRDSSATNFAAMGLDQGWGIIQVTNRDNGNNVQGNQLIAGRNTSAGAVGGAGGVLSLVQGSAGVTNYIWIDSSANPGIVRIHTAAPTGSAGAPTVSDTAGSVVGGQASWHLLKALQGVTDRQKALSAVLGTKVYDFTYLNSSFVMPDGSPQMFSGPVVFDRSEWYGTNLGRQQTPQLNEITTIGYLILSVQALHAEIEALK